MLIPFCIASTLRVAKLFPSRTRWTWYIIGAAKDNLAHMKGCWEKDGEIGVYNDLFIYSFIFYIF